MSDIDVHKIRFATWAWNVGMDGGVTFTRWGAARIARRAQDAIAR